MNPLISIIIPVYKVEKYLKKCIDSILAQSYTNIEVILIDDGSPDNCGKICDEYTSLDKRIVVVHKKNGGLSSARNAGLDIANGDYIAFVDSDDYIHKDYIKCMINEAQKSNADLVMCNVVSVDEKGEVLKKYNCIEGSVNRTEFWTNYYYSHYYELGMISCNKLYKKYIWKKLRFPNGKVHEDEFVLFHVINQSRIISVINKELYYYFQRSDSITGIYTIKRLDYCEAFLKRALYFHKNNQDKFAKTTLVNSVFIAAKVYNAVCVKDKENLSIYYGYKKRAKKVFKTIYNKPTLSKEYINLVLYFMNETIFLFIHSLILKVRSN